MKSQKARFYAALKAITGKVPEIAFHVPFQLWYIILSVFMRLRKKMYHSWMECTIVYFNFGTRFAQCLCGFHRKCTIVPFLK